VIDDQAVKQASQKLKKSLQLYPKILLEKDTQRLILKWLMVRLLPYKLALQFIQFIGKKFPMVSIKGKSLTEYGV
jgi:hypothetical protein